MKRYLLPVLLCLIVHNSFAQIPFWHQTAGPEAGTVRDVTIDSTDSRVIVWTEGSGVYRSSDYGASWMLLNRGLPRINMIRGAYGHEYLIGENTKNQIFRLYVKTPDVSWENITPTISVTLNINDIACDDSGPVYLATSEHGVLRSDDIGSTWLEKHNGLYDTLPKNKIDSSVYFLALDDNGNIFAGLQHGSIWRSTDHGDSWIKLATREPGQTFINGITIARNGNVIVGNFGDFSTLTGGRIYTTTDMGVNWQKTYERPWGSDDRKNNIDRFTREWGANNIFANAHGPTLLSTDNGLSWEVMDSVKRGDEPFSIAVNNNKLYQISEPDGVFRSTDKGATWSEQNKGLLAQFMWGISLNSKQELFGITEYGLHRSSDQGDHWDMAPEYGETYYPSLYINKKDYLYIGTDRGLFRSKDNGETLDHVVINLDTSTFNIIVQVGESPWGKLYCSTQRENIGFIESTDDGDSWKLVPNLPPGAVAKAFAFATSDTILLADGGSTYYRSTNQGINWETIPSINNNGTKQLIIYRDGSYLSLTGGDGGGVTRSTDGAVTWGKIFPPSGDFPAFGQYFSMMVDLDGHIVVCTDSGIYQSVDKNFTEWRSVSRGLTAQDFPNHFVNATAVVQNPLTHCFFAASRGLSVFKSIPDFDTSKVSVKEAVPSAASLMTSNPNPFTAHATIGFHTNERCDVRLELFDPLGRHERALFHGFLDSGEHTLMIEGSGLLSGDHIVALYADGTLQTISVTLVR
jgi:photosystem II stability/assembly factor-like uncharacterized protein